MAIALTFIITLSISASLFFFLRSKDTQQLGNLKGKLDQAYGELDFLRDEKEKIEEKSENKIELLQEKLLGFEKESELLRQDKQRLEQQRQEWSKDKETILFQLSEELIKKNTEQQNQISLKQQENIQKITADLFKNFEGVTTKVASLNDEVKKSVDVINLTKQALLSPGTAGRTAEITLENILKNAGLKEKESLVSGGDYILQSHFSGINNDSKQESKRPDAILFFSNDQVAVIDSKSSPHFLDLEVARQNNDTAEEKVILAKLKETFRKHLESLKKKDYSEYLLNELRSKKASDYKIMVIMFIQTEKMLETIREIDPDFEQRAWDCGVMVTSPIGLINLLSQARIVIDRIKQEKNIENLKIEVRKLLDNISMIFKGSEDVGKALNRAMQNHKKVTSRLNRGIYSSMKKISELGIEGKKSKDVKMLEEYEESDLEEKE